MKQIQGKSFFGYVRVRISGRLPELFFQACAKEGIPVWHIRKVEERVCEGNIRLSDISYLKKVRKGTDYKLTFTDRKGYPFIWRRFLRKKPLVLAAILSLCLLIFLSNIVWEVKVVGVTQDIEKKIHKQLKSNGVYPGAWLFKLDQTAVIQQKLLNEVPELLWIGVEKKGTALHFEGVEKSIVTKDEVPGPRHLRATKTGIIQKVYVVEGQPIVAVGDYVEKGDLLVSGKVDKFVEGKDEEDEDGEKKQPVELIAATGEVIAKTWYEVKVTVPIEAKYETLTGEQKNQHFLKFGDFHLPIWGFKTPEYKSLQRENKEKDFHLFKWELPIKYSKTTIHEKTYAEKTRTKEEAIQAGIKQAKKELSLELGPDAVILGEKVLQETIENGKVKLSIYVTVEEDIAKAESLSSS